MNSGLGAAGRLGGRSTGGSARGWRSRAPPPRRSRLDSGRRVGCARFLQHPGKGPGKDCCCAAGSCMCGRAWFCEMQGAGLSGPQKARDQIAYGRWLMQPVAACSGARVHMVLHTRTPGSRQLSCCRSLEGSASCWRAAAQPVGRVVGGQLHVQVSPRLWLHHLHWACRKGLPLYAELLGASSALC